MNRKRIIREAWRDLQLPARELAKHLSAQYGERFTITETTDVIETAERSKPLARENNWNWVERKFFAPNGLWHNKEHQLQTMKAFDIARRHGVFVDAVVNHAEGAELLLAIHEEHLNTVEQQLIELGLQPMAKKKSNNNVSKAEMIREYIKAHPEAGATAVAKALSEQTGDKYSPSQVHSLKKKEGGKAGAEVKSPKVRQAPTTPIVTAKDAETEGQAYRLAVQLAKLVGTSKAKAIIDDLASLPE